MSIVLCMSLIMINADFPICTVTGNQNYPSTIFANDQYYTFWSDMRFYASDSDYVLCGARIDLNGNVLDPDGKQLFRNQPGLEPEAAFDGANMLVVFRDSC